MKKFLKKILKYGLITIFIGNLLAFGLLYFLNKGSFYKPSFLLNQFETSKKFDYFLVGSSRGLTSIDSKQIDTLLTTRGINLSMDDTGLLSHFLMIKHFFQSGYKSKICVLTLDETNFEKTKKNIGNNDYRFISQIRKPYVKEYFKAYDSSNFYILKNAHFNLMFPYAYYNFELLFPSLLSALKPNYRNRFDAYGNYTYPNNKKGLLKTEKKVSSTKLKNDLLKDIESYLDKNNCKLVIYIAPYLNKSITIENNKFNVINNSKSIEDVTLFYDYIHVNKKGRSKASVIFSKGLERFF